ncbi:MAG: IS4 family transposase, partial [Gammaproteobacteria bacterium]|nr:IS4 family transposase [Gammaproteobacteria bacterium]
MVDGTTVTLADTDANQAAYPQPASQRQGLGFPMMRIVALLCLASGGVLDAATGPCQGKGG